MLVPFSFGRNNRETNRRIAHPRRGRCLRHPGYPFAADLQMIEGHEDDSVFALLERDFGRPMRGFVEYVASIPHCRSMAIPSRDALSVEIGCRYPYKDTEFRDEATGEYRATFAVTESTKRQS